MMRLGLGMGLTDWRGGVSEPALVARNIVRTLGPGTGGATWSTPGVTVNDGAIDYVNESGQTITEIALVFSNWYMTANSGDVLGTEPYPIQATIAYPTGAAVQNVTWSGSTTGSVAVPPANDDTVFDTASDYIPLTTPLPPGGAIRITPIAPCTGTQKVPRSTDGTLLRLRPSAVLARGPADELSVLNVMTCGDSISSGGGMPPHMAMAGIGPHILLAVIGAQVRNQGNGSRRRALAKQAGVTHYHLFMGTNDLAASRTDAQLRADVLAHVQPLADAGMAILGSTPLPRTSARVQTLSSLLRSGTTATATVPDGSVWAVGDFVSFAGASDAAYNGFDRITGVSGNNLTFEVADAATDAPTGTITITGNYSHRLHQVPHAAWAAGATSEWGKHCDWIRSKPAPFSDYFELADAFSPARHDPYHSTPGNTSAAAAPYLHPIKQLLTVASIISTSRFSFEADGGTYVGGWSASGHVVWRSGANAGRTSASNGSDGPSRQIYLNAAPPSLIAIGDTCAVFPLATARLPSDGVHPSTTTNGYGGAALTVNVMTIKLLAIKAAL